MPHHMRRLDAKPVEHCAGIVCHLWDGDGSGSWNALPDSAVVEGHAGVVRGQRLDLRAPALAVHANAFDEKDHRPLPPNRAMERAAAMLKDALHSWSSLNSDDIRAR